MLHPEETCDDGPDNHPADSEAACENRVEAMRLTGVLLAVDVQVNQGTDGFLQEVAVHVGPTLRLVFDALRGANVKHLPGGPIQSVLDHIDHHEDRLHCPEVVVKAHEKDRNHHGDGQREQGDEEATALDEAAKAENREQACPDRVGNVAPGKECRLPIFVPWHHVPVHLPRPPLVRESRALIVQNNARYKVSAGDPEYSRNKRAGENECNALHAFPQFTDRRT
mmetsp:Transcript_72260/g.172535  ORF Transcript_72260/g.172535 Transcript_72260/m.172535 type:complete len:224 (-) Transcript_72260:669-1340(-)